MSQSCPLNETFWGFLGLFRDSVFLGVTVWSAERNNLTWNVVVCPEFGEFCFAVWFTEGLHVIIAKMDGVIKSYTSK